MGVCCTSWQLWQADEAEKRYSKIRFSARLLSFFSSVMKQTYKICMITTDITKQFITTLFPALNNLVVCSYLCLLCATTAGVCTFTSELVCLRSVPEWRSNLDSLPKKRAGKNKLLVVSGCHRRTMSIHLQWIVCVCVSVLVCAAMKDSSAKLLSWSEVFGWWCAALVVGQWFFCEASGRQRVFVVV